MIQFILFIPHFYKSFFKYVWDFDNDQHIFTCVVNAMLLIISICYLLFGVLISGNKCNHFLAIPTYFNLFGITIIAINELMRDFNQIIKQAKDKIK